MSSILNTPNDRIAFTCFAATLFAAAVSVLFTYAGKTDVSTDIPGAGEMQSFPLRLPSEATGERNITFSLNLSPLHPDRYYVAVDDCLQGLRVNGRDVADAAIPFCDFSRGRTLDLGEFLRPGRNDVVALVRNDGGEGMFDFKPSAGDPVFLLPFLLFAAATASYSSYLLYRRGSKPWEFGVLWIMLAGVLVRIHYFLGTPHWVRGHDTEGHIEYVRYLLDHGSIPPVGQGWEFWQPPLYYAMVAIPAGIAGFLGADAMMQNRIMQLCALAASLLCLWIGYVIGKTALETKERRSSLWIFAATFAVFPGLVYFAARINNDVLTALLGFAVIAFLLHWWKTDSLRSWILLSVGIALSLLTKNTNLLLIPIAGLCLLLRNPIDWKKHLRLGGVSLAALLIITAWFPLYRAMTSEQQGLIGNVGNLHDGLKLKNEPASYLTFNPAKVVGIPYNNAWSDEARRQQFPEYFYKSAFFGEFGFGDERKNIASLILALSFVPLALSLFGAVRSLRHRFRASLPHYVITLVLLGGHAAFRFKYPYSSSQDFRYSILLLVPFAYFLAVGLAGTKPLPLKRLATIGTALFFLSCGVFLLNLS